MPKKKNSLLVCMCLKVKTHYCVLETTVSSVSEKKNEIHRNLIKLENEMDKLHKNGILASHKYYIALS